MPPKGYKSVTLNRELLEEVDRLIIELREGGFASYFSTSDFVRDAVRYRIEELRRIYYLGEREARSPRGHPPAR